MKDYIEFLKEQDGKSAIRLGLKSDRKKFPRIYTLM